MLLYSENQRSVNSFFAGILCIGKNMFLVRLSGDGNRCTQDDENYPDSAEGEPILL